VRVLHARSAASPSPTSRWPRPARRLIIGFNVRANPQAREMAKRDGVDIRYYSIIYNVIDDVKAA
jgi:translation initiation factor IF-2